MGPLPFSTYLLNISLSKRKKKIKIPLQCKLVETISIKLICLRSMTAQNKGNAPGFKRYQVRFDRKIE